MGNLGFNVQRVGASVTAMTANLYAGGGLGLASVEILDPQTGAWSDGPELPGVVGSGSSAVTHNGRIYVIGGWFDEKPDDPYLDVVYVLDLNQILGAPKRSMPTSRYLHRSVVFQDEIWAIGGYNHLNGNHLTTVEVYDTVNDIWTEGPALLTPRRGLRFGFPTEIYL